MFLILRICFTENMFNRVPRKMPPGEKPPEKSPRKNCLRKLTPLSEICPKEIFPTGKMSPRKIGPLPTSLSLIGKRPP